MSADRTWTEKTGLMGALRRQQETMPPAPPPVAAGSSPELVKSDVPILDPFADPPAYEAVRSLHTRSNDAFFFLDPETFFSQGYAYFQGARSMSREHGLVLVWPGVRFEVRGENLFPLVSRMAVRRADVWRVFRPGYHAAPAPGAAVIRSILPVLDGEAG